MKTITDALKKFYTKLGGDVSKLPSRTTSADLIDAMSDVYTDKEGTHVEVTTTVSEGTKIATIKTNNEDHDIYAPAGGGSGSSIINCTVTQDPDVATQFYLNLPSGVTSQDISSRLASGEYIILCAETKLYYPLNSTGDMFATMVGYDGETEYASLQDDKYELATMIVDISPQS